MSLKKSEQPLAFDRSTGVAGRTDHFAARGSLSAGYSPWMQTLIANGPLPLVLLGTALLGILLERVISPYYFRIVMLVGFNIMLAVSLQLINGFSGQFSLGHAGFMAVGAYLAAYPCLTYSHEMTDPLTPLLFYVALAVIVSAVGFALVAMFVLIRKTVKIHSSVPAVLMIAMLGWLASDTYAATKPG